MEIVIDTILEYVEPEGEITGDSRLKEDCGLTSFDATCVVGQLCETFGVSPADLPIRSIKTVRELYEALSAGE